MSSLAPRVVLVTRQSAYDGLIAAHATRGQAAFFLKSRGQNLDDLEALKRRQDIAVQMAKQAVPTDWSIAEVVRDDLDRFLFTANDIVVAIGQDGLVANLAKYLQGQPVIGVTPDPTGTEGILTPLDASMLDMLLPLVGDGKANTAGRTMVEAKLDDGQTLKALNELFIGHRSHQSARYMLKSGEAEEFQSSSGVIVSTGTGMTGWASSILKATKRQFQLDPFVSSAAFFAREPWPGKNTGSELDFGEIGRDDRLIIGSRMETGGLVFADGLEQDFLPFDYGRIAKIGISAQSLNVVIGL